MQLSPYYINTTLTIFIFIMLTISSTYSRKSCKNIRTRKIRKKNIALLTLKILSSIACIKFLIFILKENKILIKIAKWKKDFKIKFKLSLFLDKKFIFFSTTALIVSWSIIEFSIYYMKEDPLSKKFYRLLMIFLLKMLILTASKKYIYFLYRMGRSRISIISINKMVIYTKRRKNLSSSSNYL